MKDRLIFPNLSAVIIWTLFLGKGNCVVVVYQNPRFYHRCTQFQEISEHVIFDRELLFGCWAGYSCVSKKICVQISLEPTECFLLNAIKFKGSRDQGYFSVCCLCIHMFPSRSKINTPKVVPATNQIIQVGCVQPNYF